MHIIIAFLTALAGLLYALERLGVDIGWLNPWAWKRRRAWKKQSTGNPAFTLDKPIDAIALVATAAAKIDGDISIEEKTELRNIFRETFQKTDKQAAELLASSVYLLGSGEAVFKAPEKVLKRSLEKFSEDQKSSSISLLKKVIAVGGDASDSQSEFYKKIEKSLYSNHENDKW